MGVSILGLGAAGCATSPAARFDDGNTGSGGDLALTGTGDMGTGTGSGVGGTTGIMATNPDPGADAGRPTRYNDAGEAVCINIGSLGKPGTFGFMPGVDNTKAFETWLNSESSATASMILTHQKLTADFLAGFDVLILQDLEDANGGMAGAGPFWQFAPDEVDALTQWVQNGGGLITLTGYSGNVQEVVPTNSLLKFANISYNTDDVLSTCGPPVMDCYCVGNSVPLTSWVATDPIAANITAVGAFHGRTINAPDATLVAGTSAAKYAVSKVMGKGKVFVFGDEWVTYTSQWGAPLSQNTDMNNSCYMKGANKVYQVPQFWYNAIKWVAPPNTCFTINDPAVVK
jgi:hypothetical protein